MNLKTKLTLILITFFITLGFTRDALAATTRYYFSNATVPYSPATLRGTWNQTTGWIDRALGPKSGTAATRGQAETSATNPYHVLLGRWVSAGLASNVNFKNTDTVSWIVGVVESNAALNGYFKVYAYVTTGNSDTVRGVLLDYDPTSGGTEFTTTATGRGEGTMTLLNNVSAQAGDRVVIEIGYNARNAVTTSYSATMNYGNTGTTDLTQGSTSVTTRPGWIEFNVVDLPTVTTQDASSIAGDTVTANGNITNTGGANNNVRGFVYDTVSRALPGNVAPASSGYASNTSTSGSYGTGAYTASLSSLTSNTTYYIRSFSHNTAGYSYGNEISFKTLRRDVFFSVGQNTTSNETGAGNVTVSGTTATFTVDQTAINMGVGDVIDYDSDNKKCYISGKTSGTVWSCTSATGGTPTSATGVVVNSISHAFSSLSAAEAGAPTLMGSSDLTTLDIQLNFPCYYDSGADTTAVTVDGYTTDARRYITIYTPNNTATEVNQSQRHQGKWDESKYKLIALDPLSVFDNYTRIIGIQIGVDTTSAWSSAAVSSSYTNNNYQLYDSLIVRKYTGSNTAYRAFYLADYPQGTVIRNSVVYDFDSDSYGAITNTNDDASNFLTVQNVTIYNCVRGIRNVGSAYTKLINVLSYNNSTADFDINGGSWNSESNYNVSKDGTAPGANSKTNQTVSFLDEANDDFHLSQSDTVAKNSGTDLSTYFTTDIDGATRTTVAAWDVGADETATQIFRSVGPSATGLLDSDNSHADELLSITSGVATFEVEVVDEIGVGDVLIYDNNASNTITSADTLLFISGRTDSTHYLVRTHTGAVPADIAATNDTWNIYRAYTSLANAEAGTINSTLSGMGFAFNGGNRDILTNNEEWNIAAYANGTTADTTSSTIDGWTTGLYNILKIYTPIAFSEVGVSQRHWGLAHTGYYLTGSAWNNTLYILDNNIIIDGIEIDNTGLNILSGIFILGSNNITVQNSLVHDVITHNGNGIVIAGSNLNIFNNIVYNITSDNGLAITDSSYRTGIYISNNTVINCRGGIGIGWNSFAIVKNNLVNNQSYDPSYTDFEVGPNMWSVSSANNISSDATAPGNNSKINTTASFVDEANKDFHLAQTDIAAREAGANLTSEVTSYGLLATDIDGQLRNPAGTGWDIGADEGTKEFVTTVMQSGGNFSSLSSWEDNVDSDLVADTTRVFSHGGITGTIIGGNTVTGLTSGATATVVYATSTQILLRSVSGVFQSGEIVRVSVGNSVVISDNGNPASAVAKIDGAWTVADTTAVTINGWISGADNYIKVYTTTTARHSGKWDTGKYRLEVGNEAIRIEESFTKIDGLQIMGGTGIHIYSDMTADQDVISNNIIKDYLPNSSWNYGIRNTWSNGNTIYNNIVYGYNYDNTNSAITGTGYWVKSLVYNNTVLNSYYGFNIYNGSDSSILKNNIAQNCVEGFSGGDSSSDYNISDISGDAPNATFTGGFANVQFVDEANYDLHLSTNDESAVDKGINLSADNPASFSTDIDSKNRDYLWDIGADETALQIYRSVGPSATGLLDSDNSHADELLSITSGLATFEVALPDNIGVGDVVIIDTGGTDQTIDSADTLLFITSRNSSTSYNLRTHAGAMPTNIAVTNDTWQIYRAYTSLANAEAGTINSTLSGMSFSFNGGNRDLVANNEQWNIACYANGTTADTTAVALDGWNTGTYNFFKVYTPVSTNEVGVSQRHNGKWDDGKYNLALTNGYVLFISDDVRVDGLQIYNSSISGDWNYGIRMDTGNSAYISNSIVRGNAATTGTYANGIKLGTSSNTNFYVWNNIIYDIKGSSSRALSFNGGVGNFSYAYNNSAINSTIGIYQASGEKVFSKNNIVQNCTDGFSGTFEATSDYNISDLAADAPGANSKNSTNVLFVDETNKDFHLSQSDTAAKNAGMSLASDSALPFATDIDGASRNASINNWDIGADETATQIYRSVGPEHEDALAENWGGSNTITISNANSTATFASGLPDNVGVGDFIVYDSNNDNNLDSADAFAFIHGRTSSTVYTIKTQTGTTPTNLATNDYWVIFRAYTSLAEAESGTVNPAISAEGVTFSGGNRDLVTNNEEWNIACYANGTTADTTALTIDGWNTGAQNFIKVYTPVSTSEVGTSQRHGGKWDDSKYRLSTADPFGGSMLISSSYTIIDGIQVKYTAAMSYGNLRVVSIGDTSNSSEIKNSIITSVDTYSNDIRGISIGDAIFMKQYINNNIIYGSGLDEGIEVLYSGTAYVYNNTIYGVATGINLNSGAIVAKNNITQNCTNGYNGTLDASSDYNISDLATDAPGSNSKNSTNVEFVNEVGKDFHLAQTDTAARQAGTNLTADSMLPITTDIDGQLRNPSGTGWDIGADEGTKEFVTTVMQTGGNFSTLSSWEDAIDSDLVANTTRVFSHGGITGTIIGGNTVTGLTSGATATVVYATSTQILLHTVNGVFQSGEVVRVSLGNQVTISDNGNPASAAAKIDGTWTVSDDVPTNVDGWETGSDNYIKIYATGSARHTGKWDDTKYHMYGDSYGEFLGIYQDFVTLDGLQIERHSDNMPTAIGASGDYLNISNNIIKSTTESLYADAFGIWNGWDVKYNIIYNNIIYGFTGTSGAIYVENGINYVYNNTLYNNEVGLHGLYVGQVDVKNNIVEGCIDACYNTTYDDPWGDYSSNNISSDATAPGSSASKINADVEFVSTTAGEEDFHLAPNDRFAKDAGTDLSTYFTTDIDGMPRAGSWDAGADETATQIFRSVGLSATGLLDSDTSHTRSITLTGGVATFTSAVPNNVGVGDVVIIDSNNSNTITSADTLLFISKRNSSTTYQLQTATGTIPSDITINDTYQIYRAYTSLSNAEAGTINSTLSGMGFAFNGGNRDLVANNEQWNIACYGNGATADTVSVDVDGWNTGENNFLKIYTPYLSSEVGVSQRHDGKWDANKYKLEFPIFNFFDVNEEYVRIDGLQMSSGSYGQNVTLLRIGFMGGSSNSDCQVSNSIFKESDGVAISILGGSVKVWNNILYNIIADGILSDYALTSPNVSVYNNTINACNKGINANGGSVRAKNNIVQDCTNGYDGTFDASSDYNISDLAADAPGSNSKNSTNVLFLDEVGYDFRLSSDDTAANGAGINLSTDANLSFFDDIRGQARPKSPEAWSIGACEPKSAGKIKLENNIKMEGDMKFE